MTMTLEQVRNRLRGRGEFYRIDPCEERAMADAIDAQLLSQDAELKILRVKCSGTLANNLCQDHRDKQVGNPCLACTIEKLQSRIAAADALLRDIKDWDVNQAQGAYLMVPLNLRKRIQAHLSENADVQP